MNNSVSEKEKITFQKMCTKNKDLFELMWNDSLYMYR